MECVNGLPEQKFHEKYKEWCRKHGYKFGKAKADQIFEVSQKHIATMPKNKFTQKLIKTEVKQINEIAETQAEILSVMKELAQSMPEYPVVIGMTGVGENLAAQLIAEIGDIMRYDRKQSLSGYAGIDSPPNQSGQYNQRGKRVTKCGSAHLRRILFMVMWSLLINKPDDTVYHFLDKKRSENKPYRVYMVAGTNKFLKVYYGKVKEHFAQMNL